MAAFVRAEIWSDYECHEGSRLAIIQQLRRCEGREALDGTDAVELEFAKSDAAASVLETRRVVRLVFADGAFTEWRIGSVREQDSESGTTVTVTAHTPLQDMADAGAILELSLAGVPQFEIGLSKVSITEVMTDYVLPRLTDVGQTYWALGTVEPTELQDVVLKKVTPLAAERLLCDLWRADVSKRPAELRVRRNGTAGYYIDVVRRIGEFEDDGVTPVHIADLRYRKNLRRTDLTTDAERQATVLQPFGADLPDGTPSGIARVAFRFVNVLDDIYAVTDPEGGPSPVQFDGQLDGYFLVPDQGGVSENPLVEILNTAAPLGASAGTVQLASAVGITSGKVYELRANADGDFLSEMPSSTSVADKKYQTIERGDILGVRNLVGNGFLRNWPDPDGPPSDCTFYPDNSSAAPYTAQNTDPLYTQYGGKSLRITDEDSTAGRIVGLRYPPFYPNAKEGTHLHCVKVRVFFKRFAGAAWFYVIPRDGLTGDIVVDSEGRQIKLQLVASDNTIEPGDVPTIGSWVDVSIINVDLLAYNLSGVILDVVAGAGYNGTVAGSYDVFVDAVQVTQTVGEAPEGFVEYSGSNALWREGNRVLATFTTPPEHYEIDVDDLTRFDDTQYPFDQLVLGANVRLTDANLGIRGELLRIVERSPDYLTPRRTQIKVASRWEQFVDLSFAAGARPGVQVKPGQLTPQQPPPGDTPKPPTGTANGSSIVTLPIADGNTMTKILRMAADPTDAWPRQRPWFDTTGLTEMRVIADVHAAGAFGAEVFSERTADPDDEDSYVEPGVSDGAIVVAIDGPGPKRGAWTPLGSVSDYVWRARARGGDGLVTPVLGKVHFQFRRGRGLSVPNPAPPEDGLPDPIWWSKSGDLVWADLDGTVPNDGTNGSDVNQWGDKTGNGWKFTRRLSALPPKLRPGIADPRGLASIEFALQSSLASYFLQSAGAVAGRDQVTCFIVKKHFTNTPTLTTDTGIWHYGRRIGSNDAAHPYIGASKQVWESFGQGWHQLLNVTPWNMTTYPFDVWHVWGVRSDATVGTTGLMAVFYTNESVATTRMANIGIVGATSPNRWPVEARGDVQGANAYLGASYSHQGHFWCTEIVAYGAALTDAQIAAKSAALLGL